MPVYLLLFEFGGSDQDPTANLLPSRAQRKVILRVQAPNQAEAMIRAFPSLSPLSPNAFIGIPEINYLAEQTGNRDLMQYSSGKLTYVQAEYPWQPPEEYRLYTLRRWDWRLPPAPEAFLFECNGVPLWGIHLEDTTDAFTAFVQQYIAVKVAYVPNSPASLHLWISDSGRFD